MMPDYREHGWQRPHSSTDKEFSRSPEPSATRPPSRSWLREADYNPSHPPGDLTQRAERLVHKISRWSGPLLLGLAFLGLGWLLARG